MSYRFIFLLTIPFLFIQCQSANKNTADGATINAETQVTTGSVERTNPLINQLIARDAVIEVLDSGFVWTEGPLWIEDGQYLLFSDIPPNQIYRWSPESGLTKYLNPSGYTGQIPRGGEVGSNGLLKHPDGSLVMCQHGDRRIAKMIAPLTSPAPIFETIIGKYEGKRFNSPNDAIFDSQGNLYFTDPPYGLEKHMADPLKELDFQGVYRFTKDGRLSLISDKMTRPNGIALSPDEKTLYVANSDPEQSIWMTFHLDIDGNLTGEKIFYDATGSDGPGLPDGLKVDKEGNVWATGPGGVWVFSPEGEVLGKIKTGQATSNCAFDDREEFLYMTCDDYLMRIKLNT